MTSRTKDEYVVTVRSDGVGSYPNYSTIAAANSFTAEIQAMFLDNYDEYFCCLHSLEYASSAGEALKINCDVIENTRQANDFTPTLFRVPAAKATGGSIVLDQNATIPLWHGVTSQEVIRSIKIDLVNDLTGAIATTARATPTVITMVFRKKAHL